MLGRVYDRIGKDYNQYRTADSRIVSALVNFLNLPEKSTLAEFGAGTGNYTRALATCGFRMKAIEPSAIMRDQSSPHSNIEWINGVAEAVPLNDNSVNGVVTVLAMHHFQNIAAAFREAARLCPGGPAVFFTFDPHSISDFWFTEYFPEIWKQAMQAFPPINDIADLLSSCIGRPAQVSNFELPSDFQDHFMGVGWNNPEIYLNPAVRSCMSGFALADQATVHAQIATLKQDLTTGTWERRYGWLKNERSFDAGYRFLYCEGEV